MAKHNLKFGKHTLVKTDNGQKCTACLRHWKTQPTGGAVINCPGIPVFFSWESVPDNLKTKTMLGRDHRMKLAPDQQPAGAKYSKEYGYTPLYDMSQAIPKRKATESQKKNIKKAQVVKGRTDDLQVELFEVFDRRVNVEVEYLKQNALRIDNEGNDYWAKRGYYATITDMGTNQTYFNGKLGGSRKRAFETIEAIRNRIKFNRVMYGVERSALIHKFAAKARKEFYQKKFTFFAARDVYTNPEREDYKPDWRYTVRKAKKGTSHRKKYHYPDRLSTYRIEPDLTRFYENRIHDIPKPSEYRYPKRAHNLASLIFYLDSWYVWRYR